MAAYDAFISYSHAADGNLAPALRVGLERLAKRWNRRRALRVFHDQTGLAATPELWPTIQRALDDSRFFVLLASPEAAQSHWVGQEVGQWQASRRPQPERHHFTDSAGPRGFHARASPRPSCCSSSLPRASKRFWRSGYGFS